MFIHKCRTWIRLKEPAIAGYVYNPPQTPPFEKEGLVVSLVAYLTDGECCCPGGNLPLAGGVELVERVSEVDCDI